MNNARRRSPLMRRQAAYGIAYITPGMFIVLAFCILPIFMTLYYSFTSYNLAQEPKFVFLDNYQKLFTNTQLRKALWNTVIYVIITVPLQTRFWRITVPLLKPITYMNVTLGIIWSFQAFDIVYKLTGGGPFNATSTIAYIIYAYAYQDYRIGYACAVAIMLLLVILFIHLIQQQFFEGKED